MIQIGILAYQGSVVEHHHALAQLGDVDPVELRTPAQLDDPALSGIILPGGESTTISKLMHVFGVFSPLRARIAAGLPVWGTCAGMILLARTVAGEQSHLALMDITVRRNAYGRQIDSFCTEQTICAFSATPIPLVFIRAPWIETAGSSVEVLARDSRTHIIAARQANMLVTSFHPELTSDLSSHRYFMEMCREYHLSTAQQRRE